MRREISPITDKKYRILFLYIDFIYCYFKYGTVLDQYVRGHFFELSKGQRKKSVTYKRICKVYEASITPEFTHLLKNKIDFNNHFSSLIQRQWLHSKEMNFEDFSKLCVHSAELIVKPIDESEGKGIYSIHTSKSYIEIKDCFKKLKSENLVIEERLYSHKETTFGAKSLNTIRAHSLISKDGEVIFLKFILRAGVGDTVVDNYCAGGCIYEVDERTGRIISEGYSKTRPRSAVHPATNIVMMGYQLPYWKEVKALVLKAHKLIPQMRFIGWDIAITDNGPELIEGNHHPDYDLLEFVGTRFWWPAFKTILNI